jgi:hypothetical protein
VVVDDDDEEEEGSFYQKIGLTFKEDSSKVMITWLV